MPISAIGKSPASPAKANANRSHATDEAMERKNRNAEEVQKQIDSETKYAQQVKREVAEEVDRVKEDAHVTIDAEQEKNRARLANEKQKGYDEIRELQRKQQAELARVKRDGDDQLKSVSTYYRDSIYNKSRDTETELTLQEKKHHGQMELLRDQSEKERIAFQAERLRQSNLTQATTEATQADLQQVQKQELDRIRAEGGQTLVGAEEKYRSGFEQQLKTHQSSLSEFSQTSADQLKQMRLDTAQKLNAYSARQSDPFYRLVDMRADLSDEGDFYLLTARIPVHEQEKVKVDIRGSQMIVSGQRKNEEKVEIAPGRAVGTAAYQSFTESFPLRFPVDAKLLTKEFDGDILIARVPKLSEIATPDLNRQPTVSAKRSRVERPDFPDNLPIQPRSPRGGKTLS